MNARVVYFNGRFVPEAEARVSIYDAALIHGDVAFEVTRTIHQVPFRLPDHLARLWHTLNALGIDPGISLDDLEQVTRETLARNLPAEDSDIDWQIVHDVSRGPVAAFRGAFTADELRPTVIVSCYPLVERLGRLAAAYRDGVDLIVPPQRALPCDLLNPRLKTRSRLHYQLANLQAQSLMPGAWAALLDPDGYLTETTSGNLFLVHKGRLFTPQPRNILLGVTRAVVLELGGRLGLRPEATNLTRADVLAADEMFVTSTSIGILHARSFERHTFGDGLLGPVTGRLRAALFTELGLDFAAQAARYAQRLGLAQSPSRF